MYKYIFVVFILITSIITNPTSSNDNCVSVPPGGISGFWYSLFQLRKYENYTYYCASSGCLAIVAHRINHSQVYNFAEISRDNFNTFQEIKNNFIDLILEEMQDLPDMKIVTMTKYGTCIERSPRNKIELKKLLIKTTDVPFLVNTHREIDGGLCYYYMNKCKYNIKMPINYKFLSNLFNYDISAYDVYYFYNYLNI